MNERVNEWLPRVDRWWELLLLGVCCVWSPDEEGQLARLVGTFLQEVGTYRVPMGASRLIPSDSKPEGMGTAALTWQNCPWTGKGQ